MKSCSKKNLTLVGQWAKSVRRIFEQSVFPTISTKAINEPILVHYMVAKVKSFNGTRDHMAHLKIFRTQA